MKLQISLFTYFQTKTKIKTVSDRSFFIKTPYHFLKKNIIAHIKNFNLERVLEHNTALETIQQFGNIQQFRTK